MTKHNSLSTDQRKAKMIELLTWASSIIKIVKYIEDLGNLIGGILKGDRNVSESRFRFGYVCINSLALPEGHIDLQCY